MCWKIYVSWQNFWDFKNIFGVILCEYIVVLGKLRDFQVLRKDIWQIASKMATNLLPQGSTFPNKSIKIAGKLSHEL